MTTSDDDVTRCPNCEEPILDSRDRRWETEGPGEQPFTIEGCSKCLVGKNVSGPASVAAMVLEEYLERRLSEQREGSDL